MLRVKTFSSYLLLFLIICIPAVASEDGIGQFSLSGLDGWTNKSFDGNTDYQLVTDDNLQVLQAISNNSASCLYYQQRIDLEQTPWLNWRWKIADRLENNNEQTKAGDDYSARIYVVVDGGLLRWRSKALNYVWSANADLEDVWPNAYLPGNAMMLATRTAEDPLNTWFTEKRNVREDLQKVYGKEFRYIDLVAVMTDADNTGQKISSWYGNIFFSED